MEFIDVLDEKGEKTGKSLSREEVHKTGAYHRVILVAIFNKENKLLIQKRSIKKKKYPGKWDVSVAGHISSGQDSICTAIRETKEELGIDIPQSDFQLITTVFNKDRSEGFFDQQFFDIYIVKKDDLQIEDICIEEDEVEEIKFVDLNELSKKIQNDETVILDEFYQLIVRCFN